MINYLAQFEEIADSALICKISDLKPSEWAEQNIIMSGAFPGPLRYDKTPYTREIIDCFAPDHPAREIAVMGAAQFGKTASIIVPVIGYIIANNPGNIIMTVGHEGLIEEAMERVDHMLDTTGLRGLIRPSANRAKNQKTGDTNTIKQFQNGYLKLSSASNPKIWRQASYKFGLIDDYEAVKGGTKIAGSTKDLIEKRFTVYSTSKKILYISSPELKQSSNIYEVYKLGDQRKFLIPCPCCGTYIELLWETKGKNTDMAGITWKLDGENNLIQDSVGYTCQECGDFFTDQNKSELVGKGYWEPTAKPFKPGYYSYYMSALYSPHGMTDWSDYIYQWMLCHPQGQPRNETKYQTFVNLNLGLPYEAIGEEIRANELQKNIRNYEISTVPEKMSISEGNGQIVLLTLAADCNGKDEDARIDWEIIGWSESGSNYSICHGSIGTFIPKEGENKKTDRERWTYEHHRHNSVWPKLTEIINTKFEVDSDGRRMKVFISGIDVGHFTNYVWEYIDKANSLVLGLKGDKESVYRKFGIDLPVFKKGRERSLLYLLDVNKIKDDVAALINLKWNVLHDKEQPAGFMNFPTPSSGLYLYTNYFAHYESEYRNVDTKEGEGIASRWQKKSTNVMNHMWDVRIYNYALKEILVSIVCKELKIKNPTWTDCVNAILGKVH